MLPLASPRLCSGVAFLPVYHTQFKYFGYICFMFLSFSWSLHIQKAVASLSRTLGSVVQPVVVTSLMTMGAISAMGMCLCLCGVGAGVWGIGGSGSTLSGTANGAYGNVTDDLLLVSCCCLCRRLCTAGSQTQRPLHPTAEAARRLLWISLQPLFLRSCFASRVRVRVRACVWCLFLPLSCLCVSVSVSGSFSVLSPLFFWSPASLSASIFDPLMRMQEASTRSAYSCYPLHLCPHWVSVGSSSQHKVCVCARGRVTLSEFECSFKSA